MQLRFFVSWIAAIGLTELPFFVSWNATPIFRELAEEKGSAYVLIYPLSQLLSYVKIKGVPPLVTPIGGLCF